MRVKVLEVIRQGLIGGGESHVIDVVKFLDKKKFEPFVISFTEGPMVTELSSLDIPCQVIPSGKAFDFSIWSDIRKFVTENQIDLVHAHGSRAQSNVFWMANKLKKPLIYTVHGWSFHDDQKSFIRFARIFSEKILVKRADKVINVSKSNQETGFSLLGKYNGLVINNGIDLDKFSSKKKPEILKNSLKIPEDRTVVGCIMRMTKQKNPLGMLVAFSEAQKIDQSLHLLMVGDGELMTEIKQYIVLNNLHDQVTLTGSRKDIPDLLSLIDVYCLPSLWEGLPLSLLEAMATEKAIIATDVDGTKELIKEEINGFLIKPNDLEKLKQKILYLAGNPTLRREFGKNAKATVKENHNVIKMVKEIERVYSSLTNQ